MEKGEVVSIIGSSGSGKTTFLRCINFLEKADKGQILLNGNEIFNGENQHQMSPAELRKNQLNFGFVFQQFNLFPQYNVLENVTLAPNLLAKERPDFKTNKKAILKEIEGNALELLDKAGLSEKISNYPCELSGGQQQRVLLARALCATDKMILLDEPVTGLDPVVTAEFYTLIKKLNKQYGITVIMVSHELYAAVNNATHILHLKKNDSFFGKTGEYIESDIYKNFSGGDSGV
jgi:polar amino acid transport system ATP-binding protein